MFQRVFGGAIDACSSSSPRYDEFQWNWEGCLIWDVPLCSM